MRLQRVTKLFDDPDYIFELKHDGFRAIAYIENGDCKLVSRNLNHFRLFESLKKPKFVNTNTFRGLFGGSDNRFRCRLHSQQRPH
jgi:hypothetical protein